MIPEIEIGKFYARNKNGYRIDIIRFVNTYINTLRWLSYGSSKKLCLTTECLPVGIEVDF